MLYGALGLQMSSVLFELAVVWCSCGIECLLYIVVAENAARLASFYAV